jgi:hypothetical protein
LNEAQYEELRNTPAHPQRLSASMLIRHDPRTLIWGYDTDRNSFHVYIAMDDVLHIVRYTFEGFLLGDLTEDDAELRDYVPNKRVYPEACDFEFCQLLKSVDVDIPFTNFNSNREPAVYHGKLLEELIVIPADYKTPEVTLTADDFDFPNDASILMDYARESFERGLPAQVAQMMHEFDRRVRFLKEKPEDFPERIARRVASFAQDYDDYLGIPEGKRYKMSDTARGIIVPRVMAVLEAAYAQ